MSINELHRAHLDKLMRSFGVANSQSIVRNDRAIRAFGDDTLEKGKVEY